MYFVPSHIHLYVCMVVDCSREYTGQMDSERIECSAVRISENRRVSTDMLEGAFNSIAKQLPSLVINDSSVVSGMHTQSIHTCTCISIILPALYA